MSTELETGQIPETMESPEMEGMETDGGETDSNKSDDMRFKLEQLEERNAKMREIGESIAKSMSVILALQSDLKDKKKSLEVLQSELAQLSAKNFPNSEKSTLKRKRRFSMKAGRSSR